MAGYDYVAGFSNNRRTTRKMLFMPSQVLARLLADFAIMRKKMLLIGFACFYLYTCWFKEEKMTFFYKYDHTIVHICTVALTMYCLFLSGCLI